MVFSKNYSYFLNLVFSMFFMSFQKKKENQAYFRVSLFLFSEQKQFSKATTKQALILFLSSSGSVTRQ